MAVICCSGPPPRGCWRRRGATGEALRAAKTQVQNVDLATLRQQARQEIVGITDEQPIIATGHQIELYHPGVWVKNVLIEAAAAKVGGVALHVAVDTDAPKHLQLRWPNGAMPISEDPTLFTGAWAGVVAGPSAEHVQQVEEVFDAAATAWPFRPMMGPVFDALRDGRAAYLPDAVLAASAAVDQTLGLGRRQTVVLSRAMASAAYLTFVHHVAANTDRFAAAYNAGLAHYRHANGIKTASRPMPDLAVSGDRIELPFWLDDLRAERRTRAFAIRRDKNWVLDAGDGFAFDPQRAADESAAALGSFLDKRQLRLSPRALTLTMFLRLLLVDQFVHGIGGGRYDQVCDRVIHRFFNIAAPAFCVTTATLYFPTADRRDEVCIPCIKSEGHAIRHAALGEKKSAYLQQIAAKPPGSPQRYAAFVAMHREMLAALTEGAQLEDWHRRYDETLGQVEREAQLFDRELFFALQPRDRLEEMIKKYQRHF